ncbi:hypothetical protein MBLNU457_6738t1 [Dothideomycetes sp. NU457]
MDSQHAGPRAHASSPALTSPSNRQSNPDSSSTSNTSAQWSTSDLSSRSPIPSLPPTLPPIPRVASLIYSPMDRPQALRTQSEAIETYGKSETYGKRRDGNATDGNAIDNNATDSKALLPVIAASPTDSAAAKSPVLDQAEQLSSPVSKTTRSKSNPALSKQSPQPDAQSPKEARSVSLAVPYANTAALAQPIRGNRPHQAETNVKGVPQHARTSSTTIRSSPSPKAEKRGMSLRNPVSLLLRRRSSQVPSAVQEETSRAKGPTIPPMNLPEDFDPRIRGSVVHDFSAPRPKRQTSYIPADPQISESSEATAPTELGTTISNGNSESSSARATATANGRDFAGTQEHTNMPIGEGHRESAIQDKSLANNDSLSRDSWHSQDSGALPVSARQQQQLRDSNDDWETRLSGPSTSSKSDISAMSRLINTDDFGFQSPVSSATATTQDRSSLPISNDAYTRFSSASMQSGDGQAPATVMSSSPKSPGKGDTDLSLPRHVKSNASRFSFQLSGQDSMAEEKLLEAKASLKRESAEPTKQGVVSDEEEEVFDEDAMYDHDELEDGEVFGQDPQDPAHLGLGITHNPAKPGIASNYAALSSSGIYGADGQFGGDEGIPRASSEYGDGDDRPAVASFHPSNTLTPQQVDTSSITRSRASHDFDDDLYWTDGAIEPVNAADVSRVNEEDFDRSDFLKKDKLQEETSAHSPFVQQQSTAHDFKAGASRFEIQDSSKSNTFKDSPMTIDQPKMFSEDLERPGDSAPAPSRQDSAPGKTTMTAYHNALADSVQKAASTGRFTRQTSNATSASAYSSHSPERELIEGPAGAGLGPIVEARQPFERQSRDSYSGFDFGFNDPGPESRDEQAPASDMLPGYAFAPEDSRFYDDDDFDADDDIIAEANAGALANDDAGFYGQEFGFFAKARPGSSEEDNVNGGYFGERGFDIIQRKWSTKEPNLTPITERSEFSTRNSYIGGHFSPGGGQMSSPAFAAQLARMSPIALAQLQEQDMSLDQVVRMRNLALNGRDDARRSESMSSLSSAAGYSQAFPASQRGSWQTAGVGSQFMPMPKGGVPMAFQYSTESSGSSNAMSRTHSDMHENQSSLPEHRNYSSSPIVESQFSSPSRVQDSSHDITDPDATPRKGYVDSPIQNNAPYNSSPRQTRTHSRTGSGADNVTYKREKDASGNDRWVLERRRTSENGLVELVGREVVEGGRI